LLGLILVAAVSWMPLLQMPLVQMPLPLLLF
jgi:hypothetical protein